MNALVIFAKFPEPGKVKRRIGKEIGDDRSAELCRRMIEDLIEKNSNKDYDLYLSFIGKEYKEAYRKMFPDAILYVQRGTNLAENIFLTFEDLLDDYEKVIVIGSDAPQVGPDIIYPAFKALNSHDVILGPCTDGGYYLIGMKKAHNLFRNMPFKTDSLLDEEIRLIKEQGLSFVLLDELLDIDDIDELKKAKEILPKELCPHTIEFIETLDI